MLYHILNNTFLHFLPYFSGLSPGTGYMVFILTGQHYILFLLSLLFVPSIIVMNVIHFFVLQSVILFTIHQLRHRYSSS